MHFIVLSNNIKWTWLCKIWHMLCYHSTTVTHYLIRLWHCRLFLKMHIKHHNIVFPSPHEFICVILYQLIMVYPHYDYLGQNGRKVTNDNCTLLYVFLCYYKYVKNNAWVTVNNVFCDEWGASAMILTSDEVTSENHCQFASQVTKNRYSR